MRQLSDQRRTSSQSQRRVQITCQLLEKHYSLSRLGNKENPLNELLYILLSLDARGGPDSLPPLQANISYLAGRTSSDSCRAGQRIRRGGLCSRRQGGYRAFFARSRHGFVKSR